jgi:GT2 family glycosyltransferase
MLAESIPKFSVVVPNFNGAAYLGACLDSLAAQSEQDFETILVDNGSTDNSVKLAEAHPLKPRAVKLEENHGFSGAVNRGIEQTRADLIAIFNNDAVADKDWLRNLMQCSSKNPGMDFFASLVLRMDDRRQIESAGVAYSVQARPKAIFEDELFSGQVKAAEVFLASGAAMLVRRRLFEKIGKLDEDYFAYLEDVDLFLRGRLAGFRGMLCADAIVYHRGASTVLGDHPGKKRMESKQRVFLISRNRFYLIWDNLPASLILLLSPLICWGWVRGLLHHALRSGQLMAFLSGSATGFFSLPKRLTKRNSTNNLRAIKTSELVSWMVCGYREMP